MELGPLVALRLPLRIPRLAGAELAEVLRRLGNGVLEELKGHATERRACLRSATILHVYRITRMSSSFSLYWWAFTMDEALQPCRKHTSERNVKEDPVPSAPPSFPIPSVKSPSPSPALAE